LKLFFKPFHSFKPNHLARLQTEFEIDPKNLIFQITIYLIFKATQIKKKNKTKKTSYSQDIRHDMSDMHSYIFQILSLKLLWKLEHC